MNELLKRSPIELYYRICNYYNNYNYGRTFYTNACINTDTYFFTLDELIAAFFKSNLNNVNKKIIDNVKSLNNEIKSYL